MSDFWQVYVWIYVWEDIDHLKCVKEQIIKSYITCMCELSLQSDPLRPYGL